MAGTSSTKARGPFCYVCGLRVTNEDWCYGCDHYICLDTRHWKDGLGGSHLPMDHGLRWPVAGRKRRHAMRSRQVFS